MNNVTNLRKIAVKLDVSGTAIVTANTKLYKDSFGFVLLQCYIPVTQVARGSPLCTVHRVVTDNSGRRLIFNQEKFNMLFVERVEQDSGSYLLFECPMPKTLTDTTGELEIVFNYAETDNSGKVIARLASSIFRTTVDEGGIQGGDVELSLKSYEAAQINANTIAIESIKDDVENLLKPPDVSEANQVGVPDVTIAEGGGFKYKNLKGEQGVQGIQGEKGEQGIQGVSGVQGEQGVQGIQGEIGRTGATGEQGVKGETGEQGQQGEQGEIGPQGDTGQQGVKGERGEQGTQGKQGDTGPVGATGVQGLKGDKGDVGERGESGILVPLQTGFFRLEIREDGNLYHVTADGETSPLSINESGELILTI